MSVVSTAANPVNSAPCHSEPQRPARGDGCRPLRQPHGHRLFSMRPFPLPLPADQSGRCASRHRRLPEAEHLGAASAERTTITRHRLAARGSFISASGGFAGQNGTRFVEENDAVVVAPNYRLGPFGFLGHSAFRSESPGYPSAGNYGFLDQRLALEWVRTHIAAFGGDPNRITIAGSSAGGHSVGLHLVSPGSHGLFDRAIMQGGFPSYRWRTREDAEAQADALAVALGCTDAAQVLTCLRARTLGQVLGALPVGTEQFAETGRTHWGPIVDGLEIQDQPRTLYEIGAFSRVPIIIGSNRDDGWTFVNRSFPGEMTQE